MDAAMTFNWLESQRAIHARHGQEATAIRLARENVRLVEENERLRGRCTDLAASAELWIQLYEAALERAAGLPAGAEA